MFVICDLLDVWVFWLCCFAGCLSIEFACVCFCGLCRFGLIICLWVWVGVLFGYCCVSWLVFCLCLWLLLCCVLVVIVLLGYVGYCIVLILFGWVKFVFGVIVWFDYCLLFGDCCWLVILVGWLGLIVRVVSVCDLWGIVVYVICLLFGFVDCCCFGFLVSMFAY